MARPRKEIDQEQFEKLCGLQCKKEEICDFFDGIDEKTLTAWCKRTYGMGFSEVFEIKRGRGKIALRRAQFRLAERNASMAIFLGKQILGQTDSGGSYAGVDDIPDDPLTASLMEEAKRMDNAES